MTYIPASLEASVDACDCPGDSVVIETISARSCQQYERAKGLCLAESGVIVIVQKPVRLISYCSVKIGFALLTESVSSERETDRIGELLRKLRAGS